MSKIDFEINKLSPDKSISESFVKRVAEKASRIIGIKGLKEISIVLVCDKRMRSLNKKYKNKNEITDVLTFDYGEIIICLNQAQKQAKELNHSIEKEIGLLLIHGLLHLAGYKHKTKQEYNKILKKQKEVWQKVI